MSLITFLILFALWRGQTGWIDTSLLCFSIGFSFGVSMSASFISLVAGLDPKHAAVATSGFYLAMNMGALAGVSTAATILNISVRRILREDLRDLPNAGEIIRDVTSSLDRIVDLPADVAKKVRLAYAESFPWVWCKCLCWDSRERMKHELTSVLRSIRCGGLLAIFGCQLSHAGRSTHKAAAP